MNIKKEDIHEKRKQKNPDDEKILKDSLLELLEQQDIQKISIRSLCELADLNRSTFYKYYDSQYDLLKEMENDCKESPHEMAGIIEHLIKKIVPVSDFTQNA